jgi:hypothetical protein
MIVGTSNRFDPLRSGWGGKGCRIAEFATKADFAVEYTELRTTQGF